MKHPTDYWMFSGTPFSGFAPGTINRSYQCKKEDLCTYLSQSTMFFSFFFYGSLFVFSYLSSSRYGYPHGITSRFLRTTITPLFGCSSGLGRSQDLLEGSDRRYLGHYVIQDRMGTYGIMIYRGIYLVFWGQEFYCAYTDKESLLCLGT